jgi:hypothetical protein
VLDPINNIQFIPIDKIEANDYNPNVVAHNELRLLYHSINAMDTLSPLSLYMIKNVINMSLWMAATGISV